MTVEDVPVSGGRKGSVLHTGTPTVMSPDTKAAARAQSSYLHRLSLSSSQRLGSNLALQEEAPVLPDGEDSESQRRPSVQVIVTEAAELESRLREQAVDLVAPTVKRQHALDQKLKEIKNSVEEQYEDVTSLKRVLQGASAHHQMLESFRLELAKKMTDLQGFEHHVSTRISHQETQINSIRQSLESKASDAATTNRVLEAVSKSIADAREETNELRQYVIARVSTAEDRTSKLRDEFETRILQVEDMLHKLHDLQTGTDTGIQHVRSECARVKADIDACSVSTAELAETKASVACVEELHQETVSSIKKVMDHFNTLKSQFNGSLEDVKAHLQTATQTVGSSSALQMESMRSRYEQDVQRTSVELQEFMERSEGFVEETNKELGRVRTLVEEGLLELRGQVGNSMGGKDVYLQDLELLVTQLRKRATDMDELMHEQARQRAVRNNVLKIVVEANLLSSALEKQDDQDRKSVALFGYKSEKGQVGGEAQRDRSGGGACTLPELAPPAGGGSSMPNAGAGAAASPVLPQRSPRRRHDGAHQGIGGGAHCLPSEEPVLTIDKRCLSCSASPGTVLAGFKMACLQYLPAPVEYKKKVYSRSELIQERLDLLMQAREQLRSMD